VGARSQNFERVCRQPQNSSSDVLLVTILGPPKPMAFCTAILLLSKVLQNETLMNNVLHEFLYLFSEWI
jgi:hypothetical protein